jgi:hypothetical protein
LWLRERPWQTIYLLIKEEKFPSAKIKGRWESLTYLIGQVPLAR